MNNERIDLCACFAPIFMLPDEILAEWEQRRYSDEEMKNQRLKIHIVSLSIQMAANL